MKEIIFCHECIILDASLVINLCASGKMLEILKAIPSRVAVSDYVADREVLKVYTGPDGDEMRTKASVNLRPYIDSNLLAVVSPNSEDEYLDYVNFASELDDGEALTGAIAKHRNWSIGIDERKGTSFFTRETQQLQLVTTPDLIKHWADTDNSSLSILETIIRNRERRARYHPNSEHPLYTWWNNCGNFYCREY